MEEEREEVKEREREMLCVSSYEDINPAQSGLHP
jgi:hypothetical protein